MSQEPKKESIDVHLSQSEIAMLLNAINETLEAVEEWEFSTRVGCRRVELEELRKKLERFTV